MMSVLRKEMDKYRDVDEDELLTKLSEEELKRLEDELEELDPDVSGDTVEEPHCRLGAGGMEPGPGPGPGPGPPHESQWLPAHL